MSLTDTFSLITFGEAMLRIAPIGEEDIFSTNTRPSAASNTLMTVGGDELNVAVALSKLGIKSEWISIVPTGPSGDIVIRCSTQAGVILDHVKRVPDADVGIFFVLPEEKRVHYQRRNSAWALQEKNFCDWDHILSEEIEKKKKKNWFHVTGITPLTGEIPAQNWSAAILVAQKYKIPITMDFNHRKQLGTLQTLWNLTKPLLHGLDLLILSIDSLIELSALEDTAGGASDPKLLLLNLHKKLGTKLVICDKFRRTVQIHNKAVEVQTRFSVLAAGGELHSTEEIPVLHIPKDECGGGSAWAAGYISSRIEMKSIGSQDSPTNWKSALRRADLLAALCQETVGDHSTVTLKQLLAEEAKFRNIVADITGAGSDNILKSILEHLLSSKVVPILRAKNSVLAIERGLELVSLGCTALECTMDTPNILNVLKQLKTRIDESGKKCKLGVGTILDKDHISQFVGLVDFAISPNNPPGFIEECHRHNILAIPGAYSPQELWNAKLQGAQVIKLFPAQLWSPGVLQEVLNVGPYGEINVMASGGITPEKYLEWISAGAKMVAMGSRLCGNDIKYLEGDPLYEKTHQDWINIGRKNVELFFKNLNQ